MNLESALANLCSSKITMVHNRKCTQVHKKIHLKKATEKRLIACTLEIF